MRTVRFYCQTIGKTAVLDPIESRHLSRVLRLQIGAAVEVFDGCGTLANGIVESIERQAVTVRITHTEQSPPPATGRIILAVSFAKGQRFDWLVEKCTELGVDHIAAVQFERTVKLGKTDALKRLEKIVLSAAKQSRRLFLPTLSGPEKLQTTIETLQSAYPGCQFIYGLPQGQHAADIISASQNKDTLIFIGPEGGFTPSEMDRFAAMSAQPVRINPNVLRVETAAVAFCTLMAQQR